jgi:hypothetical protein
VRVFDLAPFSVVSKATTAHVGTAAPGCPVGRGPALLLAVLDILLPTSVFATSDCLPVGEASLHVGESKCITGKVLHMKDGPKAVHFIGFCEDRAACPFSVVVFASELKDVGDAASKAASSKSMGP